MRPAFVPRVRCLEQPPFPIPGRQPALSGTVVSLLPQNGLASARQNHELAWRIPRPTTACPGPITASRRRNTAGTTGRGRIPQGTTGRIRGASVAAGLANARACAATIVRTGVSGIAARGGRTADGASPGGRRPSGARSVGCPFSPQIDQPGKFILELHGPTPVSSGEQESPSLFLSPGLQGTDLSGRRF
ncbi:MAG: hypothetical protein H6Q30_2533 [Bacteroidetes bacterium]|nr:hypothetical protein [Bacteroidota bacterium]